MGALSMEKSFLAQRSGKITEIGRKFCWFSKIYGCTCLKYKAHSPTASVLTLSDKGTVFLRAFASRSCQKDRPLVTFAGRLFRDLDHLRRAVP